MERFKSQVSQRYLWEARIAEHEDERAFI